MSADTNDAMDIDEEKICRFCFDTENEEDGELISPCNCSGGQKYVHLKCLRQWQRMVLVTQPTHPAFYERDKRHQSCNVCKAEFTCPPPTRHELMASFTGPEIAGLIDAGCIIASHEAFSNELESQLRSMMPLMRRRSSYEHWVRGAFLITSVEEDEGIISIPIECDMHLDNLRSRIGPDLTLATQGRRYRVEAGESLDGVSASRLAEAFAELTAPCTIVLKADEPSNCGNDHVVAVNLTRPLKKPPKPSEVKEAVDAVSRKYKGAKHVEIQHYIGGPCEEDELMCCIVLGGSGKGWTVVKDLTSAIELAHSRAAKRFEEQGNIGGGQTVRLKELQAAPELNGEVGIALRFVEAASRWLVRLRNGEGKQLKQANLEGLEGYGGRVFAIWGDARWSRAQLLGEIAKGDWGLCRANIGDLTADHTERWKNMAGRLAFAPITEMTESYMRDQPRQMQAARNMAQMHNPAGDEPIDD